MDNSDLWRRGGSKILLDPIGRKILLGETSSFKLPPMSFKLLETLVQIGIVQLKPLTKKESGGIFYKIMRFLQYEPIST